MTTMTNMPSVVQKTKPTQIRIRILDEDVELLQKLAGKSMSMATVAAGLVTAAIDAVRENKGKLHFPPKLLVSDFEPMTEPPTKAKK